MKIKNIDQEIIDLIIQEGNDILTSKNMIKEVSFPMHCGVNTFEHSIGVCYLAVYFTRKYHFKNVNMRSLLRGALLHDFFLYDWHVHDKGHKFHGFIHANRAYQNAKDEFNLTSIEKDIILKHMFPLNLKLPHYKESLIVNFADKVCASYEIFHKVAFLSVKPTVDKLNKKYPLISYSC